MGQMRQHSSHLLRAGQRRAMAGRMSCVASGSVVPDRSCGQLQTTARGPFLRSGENAPACQSRGLRA